MISDTTCPVPVPVRPNPPLFFNSRFVQKAHRRLLEHLSDPARPSIRGFVQSFGSEAPLSARGNGENGVHKPAGSPENGVDKPAGSPENGNPGGLGHDDHRSTGGNGSAAGKATECQVASTADELRDSYNGCLNALRDFR